MIPDLTSFSLLIVACGYVFIISLGLLYLWYLSRFPALPSTYTKRQKLIQRASLAVSLLSYGICVAAVTVSFVEYTESYFVGKTPLCITGAFASVGVLSSSLCTFAVAFSRTNVSHAGQVVGIFTLIGCVVSIGMVFDVYATPETDMLVLVTDMWVKYMQSESSRRTILCGIQSQYSCSGLQTPCGVSSASSPTSSVLCPSDCGVKPIQQPCWPPLRADILQLLANAGFGGALSTMVVTTLMLIMLKVHNVVCLRLNRVRDFITFLVDTRVLGGSDSRERIPSLEELVHIRSVFEELDEENIGVIESGQAYASLQAKLHIELTEETYARAMRELSTDGRLTLDMFVELYCNFTGRPGRKKLIDFVVLKSSEIVAVRLYFTHGGKKLTSTTTKSLEPITHYTRTSFPKFLEHAFGIDRLVASNYGKQLFTDLNTSGDGKLTFAQFILMFNPHVLWKYFPPSGRTGLSLRAGDCTSPNTPRRNSIC